MSTIPTNYPKTTRDLTSQQQNKDILQIASKLLEQSNLNTFETNLYDTPLKIKDTSPVFLEALKAAISRKKLEAIQQPVHITIVWAMYKETSRLVSRVENEHGEDCIRAKVDQMNWLVSGLEHITYDFIAVDDGCPESPSSAEVAQSIIDIEGYNNFIKVIKLEDAIQNGVAINNYFESVKTTSDSRKGGSILYGMYKALQQQHSNKKHIIVYTDADLSASLTQVGALIDPITSQEKTISLGQRYGLAKSTLVKGDNATTEPHSTQEQPGKLFILFRHFVRKQLIPFTDQILDTQAGFKAFDANALRMLIKTTQSFKEIFDLDLIINTIKRFGKEAIGIVPILFTEDFALTNFPSVKPGQAKFDMITQILFIYDKFVAKEQPANQSMEAFIRALDLDQFLKIIDHMKQEEDHLDQVLFDVDWSLETLLEYIK